jgi:hypothetical protein
MKMRRGMFVGVKANRNPVHHGDRRHRFRSSARSSILSENPCSSFGIPA